MPMSRALAALLLGTVCCAAAGAAAAPAPCPSLLALVEQLPEASLFAELLFTLGATDKPIPQLSDPLPPAERRRLQGRRALAASADIVSQVGGGCPAIYQPVCSTEGEIFSNACVAGSRGATVACQGECPCDAAKPCPTSWKPVCGVDDVTYGNDCGAKANGTTAACRGECPCESADGPCPAVYDPVCGVDAFTYSNACEAGPTPLACGGPCPCPGSEQMSPEEVPAAGGDVICIEDIMDPVCGVDGENHTSGCLAAKKGVEAACRGLCPCPDMIDALQGGGGMLLVPTDDSLLNATALLSGGFNDTAALRVFLARHTILTQNQLLKVPPKPSETGMDVVTEVAQRVRLYSATKQQAGRVLPLGFSGDGPIPVSDIAVGCALVVQQIAEPLLGLPQPQ